MANTDKSNHDIAYRRATYDTVTIYLRKADGIKALLTSITRNKGVTLQEYCFNAIKQQIEKDVQDGYDIL